jgi:hypothetical protein
MAGNFCTEGFELVPQEAKLRVIWRITLAFPMFPLLTDRTYVGAQKPYMVSPQGLNNRDTGFPLINLG